MYQSSTVIALAAGEKVHRLHSPARMTWRMQEGYEPPHGQSAVHAETEGEKKKKRRNQDPVRHVVSDGGSPGSPGICL